MSDKIRRAGGNVSLILSRFPLTRLLSQQPGQDQGRIARRPSRSRIRGVTHLAGGSRRCL